MLSKMAGKTQKVPQKVQHVPLSSPRQTSSQRRARQSEASLQPKETMTDILSGLSEKEKDALWKGNHSARQREASERAEAGCADRLALNALSVGESPVQQVMTLPSDPVAAADDMAVRQMLNRLRGFQGLSVSRGGDRIVGIEGMPWQGREHRAGKELLA